MPHTAPDSAIAIYERTPYWGPELQRQFRHENVSIRECRNVSDLLPSIAGYRSALVVIDLGSDLVECLGWLSLVASNNLDRPAIIACGTSGTAELEWLLRESGVSAFLPDLTPGDEFARLCRRQIRLVRKNEC